MDILIIKPCTHEDIDDIIKPLPIVTSIMKLKRIFFFIFLFVVIFGFSQSVFAAGNIDPVQKYSQYLDTDLDNNSVKDFINWNPTNGGATVGDTTITGAIWGDTTGWINMNPTNGGVTNSCSGILGGYAWGQNTGWINFAPTNATGSNQPKVNTTTGAITGTVWSQNYGWIQLSSPNGTYPGLTTSWHGCSSGGADLCPNIVGTQTSIPPGMVVDGSGNCVTPPGGGGGGSSQDVCLNIAGLQASIPSGYYRVPNDLNQPGNCYPNPTQSTDVCPNLGGDQAVVPNGYTLQNDICVLNPGSVDVCPNIAGNQASIPNGYNIDSNGNCVSQSNPYDQCPNIAGNQPAGTVCNDPGTNPTYICSDGLDNDIDGLVDYPNDPGCISPVDNDEQNPIIPPVIPDTPTIPPGGPSTPSGPGFHIESIGKIAAPIGGIISTIGLLSTIPGFATRIVNLIFSIPFYRRRRPWGIVYDSETKEPIDPAYVTVYNADTGAQLDTKITDINGRYGFLLPVGNYRMTAQKTHYVFPSAKLMNKQSDEVYNNLYFGDVFAVTDENKNAVIALNIPMDRTEVDWNQEEKKRMGLWDFFTRNTKLWERISLTLFILGFLFSIYALVVYPTLWNIVVFVLYILFTLLQLVGFGPVKIGTITDGMDRPIPHAVVRVWNAHLGTQIAQRVANEKGQYYLLVSKGDYYITVDAKNASGGYDRLFTSETMKVHHGIVNKDFKI